MLKAQAAFSKTARLLKTDEFSSVFCLRPWGRSSHFVLHGRFTSNEARLGLVIGKKYAPRAVTRNLIRRVAREAFRVRRAEFYCCDMLLRLYTRIDLKALPSASSSSLKALGRTEIDTLFDQVVRKITKHTWLQKHGCTRLDRLEGFKTHGTRFSNRLQKVR